MALALFASRTRSLADHDGLRMFGNRTAARKPLEIALEPDPRAVWLHRPGKPKPPGNPPSNPDPDEPAPVEEPPQPIQPPTRDDPPPVREPLRGMCREGSHADLVPIGSWPANKVS